jgi:hypothetical protein
MPEITNGWARFNLADAADRKQLIESGVIWRCGQKAAHFSGETIPEVGEPVSGAAQDRLLS